MCQATSRETEITGSKNQFVKAKIRVQLKLFEACFVSTNIWDRSIGNTWKKEEIKEIERIQEKALTLIWVGFLGGLLCGRGWRKGGVG